ncbi:MAG: aminopeptidase [Candidatus Saccharibacteria bacterium]|nr:aminopeptidase [Candidatus Saccharibacteria bacterium]
MSKAITPVLLETFVSQTQDPHVSVIQRAVTKNGIYAASENNVLSATNTTIFSDEIETGSVTDQKQSGRCWLFAELNVIRHQIARDAKLDDIELSQSYSYFWDKLEKSNSFFEKMIEFADKPLDDRWVARFFEWPQGDGGWWEYAVSVIEKYGVVPQAIMPESISTSESHQLNVLLDRRLRKGGLELRKLVTAKKSDAEIQKAKEAMLADVYRLLTISIGTPPQSFDFIYKDKDKKYHRDAGITPVKFLKKYYKKSFDDYVVILNDPSPSKTYLQTYQFQHGGNVVDGLDVKWLNLDMASIKDLAFQQIKTGESIWFGCDILTDVNKKGFMSLDTYDFNGTIGVDFSLDKAERLESRDSSVNHAVTITGVDVVDDKPVQWKVENSWGDERGTKGYYTMSNDWFDKNGYVVVIRKDLLTETQQKALKKPAVMIPEWDPLNQLPN